MSTLVAPDSGAGEVSPAQLTPGAFAVGADGAATYRLAVHVPPGILGVQPELALTYRHNSGNGDLGVGWRLDGLSAVTRVPATYAVDGFNGSVSYGAKDRFALDGQRLVNVDGGHGQDGTVYNTEVQSYRRVRAGATEMDGFTVTAKDGARAWYGTTADSRVLAGDQHVRVWALSATEDLHGNRVDYTYMTKAEDGAHYLKRISYTANPAAGVVANRFVEFGYETRPDDIVTAVGGYLVRTKFRLATVQVLLGEQVVRTYEIGYGTSTATQRSVITSITESGSAADGSPTLPPTSFTWQDAGGPSFDIGVSCSLRQVPSTPMDVRTMDVTGRGRTDLVQFWVDGADKTLRANVYLAKGEGDGVTFEYAGTSVLGTFPAKYEILPADVDGNGRTDLVVAYASGPSSALKLAVFRSNGTGFTADVSPVGTGDTWDGRHLRFFAMDVNGDGRTDIVQAFGSHDEEQGEVLGFRAYLSEYTATGGTFAAAITCRTGDPATPHGLLGFWPVDVTGDGMMDLVRVWRSADNRITVATYLAVSTSLNSLTFEVRHSDLGHFAITDQIALFPVDVDGDGIQDLVQIWEEAGSGTTTLHLTSFRSTGTGLFVKGEDSAFTDERLRAGNVFAMDIDGAGATAIVGRWDTPDRIMFTAFRASPSGVFRKLPSFPGQQAGAGARRSYFLPADVDANGRADLIRLTPGPDNQMRATPYVSAGPHLDVIRTITNPLGARVTVDYAPLSDPAVHPSTAAPAFPAVSALRYAARTTPTVQPARSLLGSAIHVVSGWTENADTSRNRFAYTVTRSATYYDAKVDLTGRGWLGFNAVTMLEPSPGRRTTTKYRQDFPYVGAPSHVLVEAVPGDDPRVPVGSPPLLMSSVSNTYNGRTAGSVASIWLSETRESRFDYGADHFDHASGSKFGYDDYGNQILATDLGYVDRNTGDPLVPGDVVHHHRLFRNVETDWQLGHLLYEKATRNAVDPDIRTFQQGDYSLRGHELAARTCDVAAVSDWDDTTGTFHRTTYTYDLCGNRVSETPPGGSAITHEYDPTYHTYRMRTTSPTGQIGGSLVECSGHDPRFGSEVAHIDAGGRIWTSAHDAFGRPSLRQSPAPAGVTTDPNAVPACVTGSEDLRARFRAATVVTVEKTCRTADTAGNVVVETSALQEFPTGTARSTLFVKTFVDGRGRVRETVRESGRSAGNIFEFVTYDAEDHAVWRSLPSFAARRSATPQIGVSVAFDVLGRPISEVVPTGPAGTGTRKKTWFYGPDRVVTETAAAGTSVVLVRQLTHYRYNGHDRVRTVVADPDRDRATTTFEYDPLGRLVRSTDPPTATNPNGVSTTVTYDSLGRRTTLDCPDMNPNGQHGTVAARYAYDPQTSLLSQVTDAAGGVTHYGYDQARRLVTKQMSDGRVVSYAYDVLGSGPGRIGRIAVRGADQVAQCTYEYGYDVWGDVNRTALTVVGESSTFVTTVARDPQRRVVSRTLPDESTESSRYSFGRLVTRTLGPARMDQPLNDHDPWGRPTKRTYGTGTHQLGIAYTCGPTGQLYREQATGPSGTVLDLGYKYDQLDRLTAVDDACLPAESLVFGYRGQRLVEARRGTATTWRYEYDASGNVRGRDGYSYGYKAHFLRSGMADGGLVYAATQDACGRTASRTAAGELLQFSYDGLGALKEVRDSAGAAVLAVLTDHEGRVVRRTTRDNTVTVYVDDDYRITRTPSGQETVDRYMADGSGMAARVSGPVGQVRVAYFRRDTKGSVTHVFDAQANLVSQVAYDPFGCHRQVVGATSPQRLYEDRDWLDDVGLYDFGGRYYDPVRGRLLTPDQGLGARDPYRLDVLNRFAFELNDPVNLIDPTGQSVANVLFGGLLSTVLVGVGIGVLIASGGTAGPFVAAAIGAGVNAFFYTAYHQDTPAGRFWLGLGLNVLASVAFGAVGGRLGGALSEGITAAASRPMAAAFSTSVRLRVLAKSARVALNVGGHAAANAGLGAGFAAASQVVYNTVDRVVVGRDVGYFDNVGYAAGIGAASGALAGALVGVKSSFARPRTGERTPLLPNQQQNTGWARALNMIPGSAETASILGQAVFKHYDT
ncbi:FG-GAP-like repeat-containing protein [Kibdelosporangium phytohabitans]|uniref:Teneurin-like YD-shell domain-containing protein n=1 Tax=Kibdelosporangium phytohabitans TaxID=860235 RepID=A0A0N9I4X3_9PSEU|nr:FG-GAP-like repeat-containing protein [Kibdelosporangium phytohabitans]ALG09700.1 hypothetical protein AOZ06_24845 [Kibdelosporangium phytohabitans]MBE1468944.1 RHS repeat-associated protein [Kibdelosporangium phytohabitans]